MFLLLINGRIAKECDALLIAKGKIVKVGKGENLKNIVSKNTKVIDLNGRVVIPGFVDAHTHLIPYGLEIQRPNLKKANSAEEVIDLIATHIHKKQPKGIIIAQGYDDSKWGGSLTKRMLDRAFSNRPVAARRICGHKTIVNQRALDLLPKDTRYVDWPNGVLLERPSLYLNKIFPPTNEEMDQAVNLASKKLLSLGITTIHDIVNSRHLRCYFRYSGKRPRIRAYLIEQDGQSLADTGIISGFGDNFFKVMGIKLFLDGSIGARTAAVAEPYLDRKTMGRILINRKKLRSWLNLARKSSLQLMIHAIGDRAIKQVAGLPIETANPLRHRIEHAEILDDKTMDKIKEKNFMLSGQPNFTYQWGNPGGLYEQVLGKKRLEEMNRLKTIISKGIRFGIGTDLMPPDPEMVVRGAQAHVNPDEHIDVDTVIKYYTAGSAYLAFDEAHLGRIIEGYLADLVVLDQKETLKPYLVILDGKIIDQ